MEKLDFFTAVEIGCSKLGVHCNSRTKLAELFWIGFSADEAVDAIVRIAAGESLQEILSVKLESYA